MFIRERIKVLGVDCPTCVYSIQRNLSKLGISKFDVDITTGDAIIEYDAKVCRARDVYNAIRSAGYDVFKEQIIVAVDDLSDRTYYLESKLLSLPGIFECKSSSITKLIKIIYNPFTINSEGILQEISKLGFKNVKLLSEIAVKGGREGFVLFRRLMAFITGLIVIVYSTISMFIEHIVVEDVFPLAVIAIMTMILSGDIVVRGFRALSKFTPTMESLIALSSTASLVFGLTVLLGLTQLEGGVQSNTFFEASAGVAGFMSLGIYLEERLRGRAAKHIEDLARLMYGKARILKDNRIIEVDISNLKPGDIVEVKTGEIIPVDGIVVEGWGYVDESSFTGEPMPRLKKDENRDPVLAGCTLTSGFLRIRTTRVGRDTLLSYIIETVREAQFYKPKIARLADGIVGVFTYGVMLIALTTFLYWWFIIGEYSMAVLFSASVLAIACPCALGIAIPMVVSFAVIKASRIGLLIRRGDVFERILEVDTILFDKTGTLTIGKPVFKELYIFGSMNENEILSYLCSIESRSEHPLAKAILTYCLEKGIEYFEPEYYEYFPGMGVMGIVKGVSIAAGNREFMKKLEINLDSNVEKIINDIGLRGATPIIIAINGMIVGIVEIGDELRFDAETVIKELKRSGFKVGIVSGDIPTSVNYYSKIFNLDLAYSEMKPDDKVQLIEKFQRNGGKIAFVGDGVNDAPAISTSYLGIAMGRGSDISREAGDIVLTGNRLRDLLTLIDLSKIVKRKFIENLMWAFIYNLILIPIAAGILYNSYGLYIKPEIAALSMILSDISVILNASTILMKRT
ncbi:MAG: heavy metal translocating P-type ATPase [Candidatus Methanomethylicia archaeon]